MKNILLMLLGLLAPASAGAAGVLINGNQINPQTAISIASMTVTGSSLTVVGNSFSVGGNAFTATPGQLIGGGDSFSFNSAPANYNAPGGLGYYEASTIMKVRTMRLGLHADTGVHANGILMIGLSNSGINQYDIGSQEAGPSQNAYGMNITPTFAVDALTDHNWHVFNTVLEGPTMISTMTNVPRNVNIATTLLVDAPVLGSSVTMNTAIGVHIASVTGAIGTGYSLLVDGDGWFDDENSSLHIGPRPARIGGIRLSSGVAVAQRNMANTDDIILIAQDASDNVIFAGGQNSSFGASATRSTMTSTGGANFVDDVILTKSAGRIAAHGSAAKIEAYGSGAFLEALNDGEDSGIEILQDRIEPITSAVFGTILYMNGGATGNIGVGTPVTPSSITVNGSASFGMNGNISTFSVTGALTLANNANLTLSGTGTVNATTFIGVSGATETTTAALTGVGTAANPLGVNSSSVAVLSGGFVLNSQLDPSSVTKQGFVTLTNLTGGVLASRVDLSTVTTALSTKASTGTCVLPQLAITLNSGNLICAQPSNVTGNAATVTTNANLTGPVTSVGNATTIVGPIPTSAVDLSTVTTQFNSVATATTTLSASTTSLNAGGATTYLRVNGSNPMVGQLIAQSSVTFQNGAFSVGGSTFVVTSGKVGIGTLTPVATLEVNGTAVFDVPISSGFNNAVPSGSITQTTLGLCQSSGTINFPASGNAMIGYTGSMYDTVAGDVIGLAVLVDGGFVNGAAKNQPNSGENAILANTDMNASFSMFIQGLSSGSHTFCITASNDGGIGTVHYGASNTATSFWGYKLP